MELCKFCKTIDHIRETKDYYTDYANRSNYNPTKYKYTNIAIAFDDLMISLGEVLTNDEWYCECKNGKESETS